MQQKIIQTIRETGMMPVFHHADIDVVKRVIDICYEADIRIFEFTNRSSNASEIFDQIRKHIEQYPDFLLGIGTVVDDATTKHFIDAGAHFIVSPVMKESMATVCANHDILWIPGCATVTEIVNAKECGAKLVKIFPASVLGPQFVSSVKPVVSGIDFMPTGGIDTDEKSLSAWFNAGVVCVGLGSQLFSKEMLKEKDWLRLQQNIRQVMQTVTLIKKKNTEPSLITL
jgi:2-dehydro-3-deoxyphosphogluconate aldolase / (4S)-4-hydroxy-2-oxoglutarate aldolase